jgi:hypothetical protein
LKHQERKERTRRLIELGGLIAKAQLEHLSINTLYGSFLHIKSQLANNTKLLDQWTREGDAAFSQADQLKTAVIVSFINKPMCWHGSKAIKPYHPTNFKSGSSSGILALVSIR